MALVDTKLRAIAGKPYTGPAELSDRDGLGVRITPKGTITWQYRYRWVGRADRLTLGRYPDLSISAARALIPELRGALAAGENPKLYWSRKTAQGDITLADCCREFRLYHLPKLKPKTIQLYEHTLEKYFEGQFAGLPVEDIPLSDWLAWLDGIGRKQPKLAGHLLRRLKTVLSFCVRRQMIKQPDVLLLRTNDVGQQPTRGNRVLTWREVAQIWRGFEESRAEYSCKLAVRLTMLYGCRVSEAVEAKWEDFDLLHGVWTVPASLSKTGNPIRRPITQTVRTMLSEAAKLRGAHGYVCHRAGDHQYPITLSTTVRMTNRIREKLGLPYWRIHDFRRTLSTRLSELGVMPHVTEKMLGHTLGGVMAVYNKHDWLDDQAAAYAMWEEQINKALEAMSG